MFTEKSFDEIFQAAKDRYEGIEDYLPMNPIMTSYIKDGERVYNWESELARHSTGEEDGYIEYSFEGFDNYMYPYEMDTMDDADGLDFIDFINS